MSTMEAEVDFESDFESDYEADYEDILEFEPERRRGRRQYRTPRQPPRGTGPGYTRPPVGQAAVTQEQLRQALVRVKQDIDRVASGVRSNTTNLNDFAARTGRNLNRLRDMQRRDVARLDRGIAQSRELGILGAVLGGGGSSAIIPLLILGMEQPQVAPGTPGAPADGTFLGGGSSSTTLLLALALTGALNP
jgi:hypothetical protein